MMLSFAKEIENMDISLESKASETFFWQFRNQNPPKACRDFEHFDIQKCWCVIFRNPWEAAKIWEVSWINALATSPDGCADGNPGNPNSGDYLCSREHSTDRKGFMSNIVYELLVAFKISFLWKSWVLDWWGNPHLYMYSDLNKLKCLDHNTRYTLPSFILLGSWLGLTN